MSCSLIKVRRVHSYPYRKCRVHVPNEIDMRKISQDAANHFNAGKNFKRSNTEVISEGCGSVVRLYLFGNCIAQRTPLATTITTDGWMTDTTKERLNALNGVQIHQEKGRWFLNGEPWNGDNVIIGAFGIWQGF